jgi:hypothetical protein
LCAPPKKKKKQIHLCLKNLHSYLWMTIIKRNYCKIWSLQTMMVVIIEMETCVS